MLITHELYLMFTGPPPQVMMASSPPVESPPGPPNGGFNGLLTGPSPSDEALDAALFITQILMVIKLIGGRSCHGDTLSCHGGSQNDLILTFALTLRPVSECKGPY